VQFVAQSVERLGMSCWGIPCRKHRFLEIWETCPEVLEFERRRAEWACMTREKERTVIRMGVGEGVWRAGVEGHVPILVAESAVQQDQSWSAAFVAPSELFVL
jgi:hypothetical protein